MDVITHSDLRERLEEVMDQVVVNRAPVVVTRQDGEAVVMVSLSDWTAVEDSVHLLSSPANAARLAEAIAQLDTKG